MTAEERIAFLEDQLSQALERLRLMEEQLAAAHKRIENWKSKRHHRPRLSKRMWSSQR